MAKTSVEELARAMYASYLAGDFVEALVLGEHVVEQQPEHALAHAVVARCRAVVGDGASPGLHPSSILRLRPDASHVDELPVDQRSMLVLDHLDGISDAATIADLAGIPRLEALDHLLVLLEHGVVEVVA